MLFWDFLSHVLALPNWPLQLPLTSSSCHPGPSIQSLDEPEGWMSFSQPSVALPHGNPTKSFWTHGSADANPLATEGSDGPMTTDADIVIIGSGITGVGTAYHLSELAPAKDLPLNIVILEARDFCSGATGRNGGHLTPTAFKGFLSRAELYNTTEALRWLAIERHTAASLVSILNSSTHEVDLVHGSHLDLFFTDVAETGYKADWEAAMKAGVDLRDVQFLSREETHQKYGPKFPSVLSSGHNLWPLKAVTQLFRLAQQNIAKSNIRLDLKIHTQTPVTSITRLETLSTTNSTALPRRWIINTTRGSVRAHTVIHATNGYAAHLLPFLTDGPDRVGIIPTRGQIIATRSNVGLDKLQTPSYSNGFEYWFPRPVNDSASGKNMRPLMILGGGRQIGGPNYEMGITDDSVINLAISGTLKRFLPQVYPKGWFQKGQEPEMEWTGIMGYTRSGNPLVGPVIDTENGVVLDGQYIAAGYTGHGMPRAFGCAEALVQLIVSAIKNETWEVPDWFPNHFLTTSQL